MTKASASHIPRISERDAQTAFAAAQCVVKVHQRLVEWLKVGVMLPAIDSFIAKQLHDLSCRSCFIGYKVGRSPAFPSHACLSVNECIVHGTAGYYPKPMQPGDVLKLDIGVWYKGFIGDAAWTYTFKEFPSPQVERLVLTGRESLQRGIEKMQPGLPLIEFARAVQTCVEGDPTVSWSSSMNNGAGFHLTRGLGGHGIGRKLHAPPFVSNVVPISPGDWPESNIIWEPGMLVAVEPMLAIGTSKTIQHMSQWPVFTADGSIAAHFEHDVLITEQGPRILTEGLDELPLIVG